MWELLSFLSLEAIFFNLLGESNMIDREIMIKVGIVGAIILVGASVTLLVRSRKRRPMQTASQQLIMKKQEKNAS